MPRTYTFDELPALSSEEWEQRLTEYNYYPAVAVVDALRGLMIERSMNPTGAQALLLGGPPGVGKTYLGETLARMTASPVPGQPGGSVFKIFQFHSWADSSDLFVGVNVQAAVARDHKHVNEPGVLAQVAHLTAGELRQTPFAPGERSANGRNVVLVLDEIDKAPERIEALLLDYLQSGRVPIAPGRHLYTDLSRLLVVVTSNAMRPLTDAFLRRVRRVNVPELPVAVMETVLVNRTGYPLPWIVTALRALRTVAQDEGVILSIQEAVSALHELAWCDRALLKIDPTSRTGHPNPALVGTVEHILVGRVVREVEPGMPLSDAVRTQTAELVTLLGNREIEQPPNRARFLDAARPPRRTTTPVVPDPYAL